ncbi:hypothetical protein [Actinophytocola sp.]|uniref:hypothetical protein n=1 Tax=Actinophytocola sp. TaxID=1872138 RepID=UPI003D6AF0C8
MDGFGVEVDELTAVAARVDGAVAPAGDVRLGIRGGAAYGGAGMQRAVTEFCATWQLALARLVERGQAAGATLAVVAGAYADGEDTARHTVTGPMKAD